MATSPIPTGRRAYHRVRVLNPTTSSVEGDVVQTWAESALPWYVALDPTVGVDQERTKGGTTITQPSVTVTGPWRPDITTASRLVDHDGRILHVVSADSPDRRRIEIVCQCSEVGPSTGGPEPQPPIVSTWLQPGWTQVGTAGGWAQ